MPESLELAAEFYPVDAIERGAAAFSEVAAVTVTAGARRHRVVLAPHAAAEEPVALAFANWVLAAAMERRDGEAAEPATP